MRAYKDIAGQRFGKLLAIEKIGRNKGRSITWRCRCDCGVETISSGTSLRAGHAKSCGCARIENIKLAVSYPSGDSARRRLYQIYKRGAEKYKRIWELTIEQFGILTKENCYYCGRIPEQIYGKNDHLNGDYIYNGIDRINNDSGYVAGNMVACCKFCNMAKGKLSQEDFIVMCNAIAKKHPR